MIRQALSSYRIIGPVSSLVWAARGPERSAKQRREGRPLTLGRKGGLSEQQYQPSMDRPSGGWPGGRPPSSSRGPVGGWAGQAATGPATGSRPQAPRAHNRHTGSQWGPMGAGRAQRDGKPSRWVETSGPPSFLLQDQQPTGHRRPMLQIGTGRAVIGPSGSAEGQRIKPG